MCGRTATPLPTEPTHGSPASPNQEQVPFPPHPLLAGPLQPRRWDGEETKNRCQHLRCSNTGSSARVVTQNIQRKCLKRRRNNVHINVDNKPPARTQRFATKQAPAHARPILTLPAFSVFSSPEKRKKPPSARRGAFSSSSPSNGASDCIAPRGAACGKHNHQRRCRKRENAQCETE